MITIKKDKYPEDIGISWDEAFTVRLNNRTIGCLYLSVFNDSIHIEWVEIEEEYRGKGYLRDIVDCVKALFPEKQFITAEASCEHVEKYRHLGFLDDSYYDFREMWFLKKVLHTPMTIREFESKLETLDTEFRESLARYFMHEGWIDTTPLLITYKGTAEQRKALKAAYSKPLTKACIDFIAEDRKNDFQLGEFLRIAGECNFEWRKQK